ncbi:MAG: S8 family peptidase [Bacteroidales bacterium]|jgi:subtilisin family serine protease|nr:S8 family peptidase [Bacteroidales bacterium]
MKRKLILLIVLAIVQVHFHVVYAQQGRDPHKEILVFFTDGVQRETQYEKGITIMYSSIKSETLRAELDRIGINEQLLEVANPTFREVDTLTILSDGTRLIQANMTKLFRIHVPEGRSRTELIGELNRLPEVLYAEANGTTAPSLVTPNDERYGEQWALQRIQAETAWDIYTGNPNSVIAIFDGGVDINHEDLRNKISGGDATWGWGGHGIHVAGIAAASTNNTHGIAGVDWNARIHPRRVDILDDVGIYNAIINSVNSNPNAYVFNHSWELTNSNGSSGRNSSTVAQAFAYAHKANRTSVVSMGNHQLTQPNVITYPAGFGGVISVGSTNSNDVISSSSAQGNHIDVSAPGVSILSTYTNGDYTYLSGTSMAAPHVAGLASLLKGYRPQFSNDDITQIIRLSADKVPAMNGANFTSTYGYGRINAGRALEIVRDNHVRQWTATGGISQGASNPYQGSLMGVSGLASQVYFLERHEVHKTVTFPEPFLHIEGIWGRGVGTTGWSRANPNFGIGFCEVVSYTSNSVTLRTYVYLVRDIHMYSLGWHPTTPVNTTFAYTVLGTLMPTIFGPDFICFSGDYTLDNNNLQVSSWKVEPDNLFDVYPDNNKVTVRAIAPHGKSATLSALVNGVTINKTIKACSVSINGPDVIGKESCQATYTYSFPPVMSDPAEPGGPKRPPMLLDVVIPLEWRCDDKIKKISDENEFFEVTFKGPASSILAPISPGGPTVGPIVEATVPTTNNIYFRFWYHGREFEVSKRVQIRPSVSLFHGGIYAHAYHGIPAQLQTGVRYYLMANLPPPSSYIPSQYRWEVSKNVVITNPQEAGPEVMVFTGRSTENQPLFFPEPGQYIIKLRVLDGCGWTLAEQYVVTVVHGFKIIYSPNPVNSELTIEFEELPTAEDQTVEYTVKLLDNLGNAPRQTRFRHHRRDGRPRPVKFNTSSLPPGTYYLHVEGAGELIREQIIVTR